MDPDARKISGLYFHCNEAHAAYLSETRTALTSEAAASEIGIHHGDSAHWFRAITSKRSRVASKCRVVAISRVELGVWSRRGPQLEG